MFKLLGKKIIEILQSIILLNWTYGHPYLLSHDMDIALSQCCFMGNGVARTLKKGRLLDQAMILFNYVPFQNGNFS